MSALPKVPEGLSRAAGNAAYAPITVRSRAKHIDNYYGGGTDDDVALAAAVADSSDGGALEFADRTYTVASGHVIDKAGFTLRGAGKGSTVVQLRAGETGDALEVNSTTSYKQPFTLEGLDIFGVTGSGHGLRVRYASLVSLRDVRLRNHGGDGLRMYEVTSTDISGSEMRGNTGNGATLGKKTDALSLRGCSIYGNGAWGLVAGADTPEEAGGNGRLNALLASGGTTIIGNGSGGMWVRAASTNGVEIKGLYFENNTTQHLKIGESGGGTVHPVTIGSTYFNHASATLRGIDVWNCTAVILGAGCFFENIPAGAANGALKLNVASTPWDWQYGVASGGSFAVQDSAGTNWTSAILNGVRSMSGIKLGPASPTGAAEFTMDYSDTSTTGKIRVVQSGNPTSGALVQISQDGTSNTAEALFLRNKGTGNALRVADNTGDIFRVQGGGKVGFFAAAPAVKQTVTGSRGANAALASVITALATYGIVTDSSTA